MSPGSLHIIDAFAITKNENILDKLKILHTYLKVLIISELLVTYEFPQTLLFMLLNSSFCLIHINSNFGSIQIEMKYSNHLKRKRVI